MSDELADLTLQFRTLASQFTNAVGLIEQLKGDISQYKSLISTYRTLMNGHCQEAKRIYEENKKLADLVVSIREEFSRNLTTSHKEFMSSLESVRKSVQDCLSNHMDVKSILDATISKIETVALEAKNAVMKASQNDIIINLHHQKFDSIFTKINNLELMRQ